MTAIHAEAGSKGSLGMTLIKGDKTRIYLPDSDSRYPLLNRHTFADLALPKRGLPDQVNDWRSRNAKNLMRGLRKIALARVLNIPHMTGELFVTHYGPDGEPLDFGLASLRVVTTVGVGFIVDAFQNSTELETMKYHGYGTGTNAEAVGDTVLQTELTTQYNPDSTRPTGTTTEAAANIYQTVATLTPDTGGTIAVTEHGIFSQAATGGGVLLDRSQFAAVNVVAAQDSLQTDYRLTFTAGS